MNDPEILPTTYKLNIGCGNHPIDGYTNVDAHNTHADVNADLFDLLEHTEYHGRCTHIGLIHVLEHIAWRQAPHALNILRTLLTPGGQLTVEVPDMERILQGDTGGYPWISVVYGVQDHPGEYHRNGYTQASLTTQLRAAGYRVENARTFESTHPERTRLPCLEVTATR